jgi:hypothetical protein
MSASLPPWVSNVVSRDAWPATKALVQIVVTRDNTLTMTVGDAPPVVIADERCEPYVVDQLVRSLQEGLKTLKYLVDTKEASR